MDVSNLAATYDKIVRAIRTKQWDEALTYCQAVSATWGSRGIVQFGPVFGHFYYLRGMALVGKQDYAQAAQAFQTCYEDFVDPPNARSDPNRRNRFRIHSLVQWAGCKMIQGDHAGARALYERALAEGVRAGVDRDAILINLSRCYMLTDNFDKGSKLLLTALAEANLPPGQRRLIFLILAEDWSPQADFASVREFVHKYGDAIDGAPIDAPDNINGRLQALAGQAVEAAEPMRALLWYSLANHPGPTLATLQLPADRSDPARRSRRDSPAAAQDDGADERARLLNEYWLLLGGVGNVHYNLRNFSASYAAFSHLCRYAGQIEQRPAFLHNATASAAQLGFWKEALTWGQTFLSEYPDDPLKAGVSRLLVESIFIRGDHAEAYRIAGEIRRDMPTGSEARDIPDFIFAASAYHLQQFSEAENELEAYLQRYTEGQRRSTAEFYLGATKVKLQKWDEGVRILDAYLEHKPDAALIPSALYQAALCKSMTENFDGALAQIERVITEFPEASDVASAWNLRGDILKAREVDPATIQRCYQQARLLAEPRADQAEVAAYALWQLIILAAGNQEWETLGNQYDAFQQQHPQSIYRYEVLGASLEGLVELGRTEEALVGMRTALWELGEDPTSRQLSEIFGSYVDFLQQHREPDAALAELATQLKRPNLPPALEGWLRVGMIETLENAGDKGRDAQVQELFFALQARLKPEESSNYVIVRLARWLAASGKNDAAKQLYAFILDQRPDSADSEFAMLDMAQIEAEAADAQDRSAALAKFRQILAQTEKEDLREPATLGVARLLTTDKQWGEAQAKWEEYLANKTWSRSRPEANYEFAHCLDEQGRTDEALKIYVSVYVNFPGHLDWSTRAYIRTALILRERGKEKEALLVLRDMLQRMQHLDHPGVAQAAALFQKWRAEYKPTS